MINWERLILEDIRWVDVVEALEHEYQMCVDTLPFVSEGEDSIRIKAEARAYRNIIGLPQRRLQEQRLETENRAKATLREEENANRNDARRRHALASR